MMDHQTQSISTPVMPAELAARLSEVVGSDNIYTDRQQIDQYRDAYWLATDDSYEASAVVLPKTTAELQEIVRLANDFRMPLWVVSQGRNLGHGGPSPRLKGSIQVVLSRMNQIIKIDEELAYAVVEPGVTWQDLYNEVQRQGLDLLTPCPDLGWGSIIGNSMDSGHTYQHYAADYQMPTGMEVVLPDGDVLRTGQGTNPDSKLWNLYKRSLGPSLDSFFIQSNLGVVTKMGVWLKRKPKTYAPVVLVVDDDADLELAVDTLRELRLAGDLEGIPAIYSTARAAHMILDKPLPPRAEPYTDEELSTIGLSLGVGAWAVRAYVWGDRDVVELRLQRIRRAWEQIPSARVQSARIYEPHEYESLTLSAEMIGIGIPTVKALETTPPNVAHLDISPAVPLSGTDIRDVVETFRQLYREANLNFGVGIMVSGERSAVAIAGIRYDCTDETQVQRAFQLGRGMQLALAFKGYSDTRPHLEFMDFAAEQHSFNSHAHKRFLIRIKDTLDPKGILAPGRHGIWPSTMRYNTA